MVVLADEVYERCTFSGDGDVDGDDDRSSGSDGGPAVEVVRMADVHGMRGRTLTIGTSSKLLCLTGWRVGWMMGPPGLVGAIRTMHAYATFCAPTPLQLGVAAALEEIADEADSATRAAARAAVAAAVEVELEGKEEASLPPSPGQAKRAAAAAATSCGGALTADATAGVMANNARVLAAALTDVGLRVFEPRGGYFLVADVAPLSVGSTGGGEGSSITSVEYCRQLAHGPAKVAAVPLDVFYDPTSVPPPPTTFVRFAVCKKPETIAAAAAAIRANPVTAAGAGTS